MPQPGAPFIASLAMSGVTIFGDRTHPQKTFAKLSPREETRMQPFITDKQAEIIDLCRTHHVRRLSIFGSAVRDDFDPVSSDVDVRVEFDDNIEDSVKNYFDLHDKLAELFGRDVDILSSREIENPFLRKIIDSSQVTLYAA
jgi:predicted nucleotidyltransferase